MLSKSFESFAVYDAQVFPFTCAYVRIVCVWGSDCSHWVDLRPCLVELSVRGSIDPVDAVASLSALVFRRKDVLLHVG